MACNKCNEEVKPTKSSNSIDYLIILVLYILLAIIVGAYLF